VLLVETGPAGAYDSPSEGDARTEARRPGELEDSRADARERRAGPRHPATMPPTGMRHGCPDGRLALAFSPDSPGWDSRCWHNCQVHAERVGSTLGDMVRVNGGAHV
jgi:hypothetical protein